MNEQVVGHVLFVDYPPFQLASLPLRMQNAGEQHRFFARLGMLPFECTKEWYNDIYSSCLYYHCIIINNNNNIIIINNRSEWSPQLRSVIIRVLVSPRLQTELDAKEFCYRLIITMRFFKLKIKDIPRVFCWKRTNNKKTKQKQKQNKTFTRSCAMTRTVILHCPAITEIRTVDSQSHLRILLKL